MATTTKPPPPKSSGNGYIIAGIAMLLAMGGLIVWKVGGKEPAPAKQPDPPKVAKTAPVFEEPPPPPPPIEEVKDAEAEKQTTKKIVKGGGGGSGACSDPCEGTATAALQGALRSKGGQARGCYERALRVNQTLQGRVLVSARIGPQGQVCSASISQNTLGDSGVASCISQMFRAGKFPAPNGGCVDVNVPLNFVPRTQ